MAETQEASCQGQTASGQDHTERGQREEELQKWRQCVQHWFPKLPEGLYFVPPVYMNRQRFSKMLIANTQMVEVHQSPVDDQPADKVNCLQTAHVRDDMAHQRILLCLREMAKDQGNDMVVLTQLEFGDFLEYAAYVNLPRPADLKHERKHEGDFDMIIIHRHYGLLVLEIKVIGDNFADLCLTEDQADSSVADKVKKVFKQLTKARDMMKYLLSDQFRPPRVRYALVLPNIATKQLRQALKTLSDAEKDVLDAGGRDPVSLCVCEDQLSPRDKPWEVGPDVLASLRQWWSQRVTSEGEDPAMNDHLYEDLIMRFCGPATTVRVYCPRKGHVQLRSEAEGVAETGERFTHIVLTPRQVDTLLHNPPPKAYVTGPPGTGKTFMLYLMALEWARKGRVVVVLSTCTSSLAASRLILSWLQTRLEEPLKQNVQFHHFDLDRGGLDKAETTLIGLERSGHLCVVADEVPGTTDLRDLCRKLSSQIPSLFLWAASIFHKDNPDPAILTELVFREPLRTPPSVTREVDRNMLVQDWEDVYKYEEPEFPLPTYGPLVKDVSHAGHEGEVVDCMQCGKNVAAVLNELHVGHSGVADEVKSVHSARKDRPSSSKKTHFPEPLFYRDVFLLTRHRELKDEVKNTEGHVTQPASGIIRGLREENIPVRLTQRDNVNAADDVATMRYDEVMAGCVDDVTGLERKIVVWIKGRQSWDDIVGRLLIASRCTAQLIRVSDDSQT